MTKLQIQKMKDTDSLVLTRWDLLWHYSMAYFFLLISIMVIITNATYIEKYPFIHQYNPAKSISAGEVFFYRYLWLVFVLLALLLYYIQTRRLKFKVINISVDEDKFKDAAKRTAKELNWKLTRISSDLIIAKSGFSLRSWGELITIVRDNDRVLINSICDPGKWMSVASFGMNKNNRDTYEQFLRDST